VGNLLVFDVDGTLIDSERSIIRCIDESSRKLGYKVRNVSRYIGVLKLTQILKNNGIKDDDIKVIMESYRECYFNTFEQDSKPTEDSATVLKKLQSGNELGILTLKDLKLTKEIARRFFDGIEFKYVVCGDRPITDKVEGLRLIIEESGKPPEKIFYIGDRAGDVRSAIKSGVNAVWVSFGMGKESELDFKNRFLIARNFQELLKMFSSQT
jgi:phosphoglycolate phosphatase